MLPAFVDTPGGGKIGLSPFPKIHELQDFKIWRAKYLVTLVEAQELAFLGIRDMRKQAEQVGLDWHHLPVGDMAAPDAAFEAGWAKSGPLFRKTLLGGGRLVVHCRAGLGRTGMVGARLLVELGVAPDAAIAAIRKARPGSIETVEQEEHVRACQAVT